MLPGASQRWPESLFQTPTPFLFQNFWILVQEFFNFENPALVQTPATIIDPIVISHAFTEEMTTQTAATAEIEKSLRVQFFTNFWLWDQVWKKNTESCRCRLRKSGSGATSGASILKSLYCSVLCVHALF